MTANRRDQGFEIVGKLASGQTATLRWHGQDRQFSGDQCALDEVYSLIARSEVVGATAEGPFFVAAEGDFRTALATAGAVFEQVLTFESDRPVPEYRGGVVQRNSDIGGAA